MSLIRRNPTRVAKNSTDITAKTDTPSSDTVSLALTSASDKLYLGFRNPFASRYFYFSALNTNACTLTVKYWNGSSFAAVEDLVDQTEGFTKNGFIAWQNLSDWQSKKAAPWANVDLFWIEITVSADLSVGTTLQAVLNIFCDDTVLSTIAPELVSDTRYLPSGQTTFLAQYQTAADMVVNRLKADGIIDDEDQLIDVNEVSLAAGYYAGYVILFPIARDDDDRARAKSFIDTGNKLLNKVRLDIDYNNSGEVEDDEKEAGNVFLARG